jgi:hypothetical protein
VSERKYGRESKKEYERERDRGGRIRERGGG